MKEKRKPRKILISESKPKKKLPYKKPKLTNFGKLKNLTMGASKGVQESGTTPLGSKRA